MKPPPVKHTIIVSDPAPEETRVERISVTRCVLSVVCALAADGLQLIPIPLLWYPIDAMMVIALLVIWGWRWEIAVAVIPEVIPGIELFPTWTLFVGYLIALRRGKASGPKA